MTPEAKLKSYIQTAQMGGEYRNTLRSLLGELAVKKPCLGSDGALKVLLREKEEKLEKCPRYNPALEEEVAILRSL
jgi:hypothetical protein